MKKTALVNLTLALLVPLTVYLGTLLPGRAYYLTSTALVIYALIPFFLAFEGRRPQARELVIIAVLCALAVVCRAAFVWLPHFKPMFAIIMISGIAFGRRAGFLVGAVSALVSNLMFGQGPWTPWQMLAYGMAGLLSGIAGKKNWIGGKPVELAFFSFFAVLLVVCPLLDTSSVFTTLTVFTPASVLAVYASGIPVNLQQAVSTAVFMLVLSKPMLEKLTHVKVKYGLL